MTKSPAFQFYPNDWLSSASIAMMTPEQEGAYIRLLCYCWASGDCTITSDESKLLSLSRLKDIENLRVVAKCFNQHPTREGFLVHERLLKEHQKQLAWRIKSSSGGKKSAAKRIDKQKKLKGGSQMVEECLQPKPNSSSSSSSSNTLSKDNDDSAKAALWKLCRGYLGEKKMSLVGKWVKEHGEVKVFDAVLSAQKQNVADPVAYVTKILEPVPWNMKPQNRMPSIAGG